MKKSIFYKIFAGYLVISLLLTAAVGISFFTLQKNLIRSNLTTRLTSTACALQPSVTFAINDPVLLEKLVKKKSDELDARITIIRKDGLVLADSHAVPSAMDNHASRPEVMGALTGKPCSNLRTSDTVKKDLLYLAYPVLNDSPLPYILRVSMFAATVSEILNRHKLHIFLYLVSFFIVSLIAALIITANLSAPIRQLRNAGRLMAEGDFPGNLLLSGQDEISDLAGSFNDMNEKMRDLFIDLRNQKDRLEYIISSIGEGLFVIDRDGLITHYNHGFIDLAGCDNPRNRPFYEVIRNPELGLIGSPGSPGDGHCEISLDNRHYTASFSRLPSTEETVVILHDISEQKSMEKLKRDFVHNVSHELRTPLTSIKGFVETLEEETTEENLLAYLAIIRRNTDRLINIVNDLITLNELENCQFSLRLSPTDIGDLVSNVSAMFRPRIMKKRLSLEMMIEDRLPEAMVDPFRIEQVLINLIDNAVKYTEKGGISIQVLNEQKGMTIVVSDTGAGIPLDHQARIFERFYVVDRSRSRKLGGTGLGLSIVKHIVNLHNGEISCKSSPSGTVFSIFLPFPGKVVS